jgi:TRAP-type C4-dicarboxylate transport system substrate-binding protein
MNVRCAGLVLLLAAAASGTGLSALTLKIAANLPANSPWDLGLRRLAVEFTRVSGGKVNLAFPQSARVATDSDIIQKMHLGVDGALLTSYGIAELYPDSLALSMPCFIRDDVEFDAVLAAIDPLIKAKLAERYVVLALSKGGWVRYFSRSPILYPSDLARLRISTDPGDDKVNQLMQSLGARTLKGTIADFLLRINSNTVDATCVSPVFIASLWSQLRGKIGYMSSFRVAPFVGCLILNKSSWEKVPADLRPQLEQVTREAARQIGINAANLEADAIASLDGIKSPPEPADAAARWAELTAAQRKGIIARLFSADILEAMDAALVQARKSK